MGGGGCRVGTGPNSILNRTEQIWNHGSDLDVFETGEIGDIIYCGSADRARVCLPSRDPSHLDLAFAISDFAMVWYDHMDRMPNSELAIADSRWPAPQEQDVSFDLLKKKARFLAFTLVRLVG